MKVLISISQKKGPAQQNVMDKRAIFIQRLSSFKRIDFINSIWKKIKGQTLRISL